MLEKLNQKNLAEQAVVFNERPTALMELAEEIRLGTGRAAIPTP